MNTGRDCNITQILVRNSIVGISDSSSAEEIFKNRRGYRQKSYIFGNSPLIESKPSEPDTPKYKYGIDWTKIFS